MNEKLYEALERLSIMTVDGGLDDVTACKYIQEKYGRETAVKLWEKYCKNGQSIR